MSCLLAQLGENAWPASPRAKVVGSVTGPATIFPTGFPRLTTNS